MADVLWQSTIGGLLFVVATELVTRLVRPIFKHRRMRRWEITP